MAHLIPSGKCPGGRGPGGSPLRRLCGIAFVALMVTIAMAITIGHRRATDSVLRNNLFTLRTALDNYAYDKAKAPQSLDDLVSAGYLRVDAGEGSRWNALFRMAVE